MNTTTTRTELALAACEGLSDEELQKRGAGGYKAMRDRKRDYASKFRALVAGLPAVKKQIDARDAQIAELNKQVQALQNQITELQQDAPIADTSVAAELLAKLSKGGATE